MIKRYFRTISLLALLPWIAALAVPVSFERGLLFEVRSQAGEPSYLFGTIHSEDERILELPAAVRSAFARSRSFVTEVIPDPEAILRSMVTMVYTDGRSLAGVLGPERFRDVVAAVESRGLGEEAIKDYKPWAIVMTLNVPPPKTGEFLDKYLYTSAVDAGKPALGLETITEQLAVFDGLSESDQVVLLDETLEVLDELPDVYERLLEAYLQRDLLEVSRLGRKYLRAGGSEAGERFMAVALHERNERMVERMIPLLERGGHFVAVGVLHLPGAGGILERLQAAGYRVRQLY